MGLDAIRYETGGEINWDALQACWNGAWGDRNDDAYVLFRDKKDLSEGDRSRLFRMLDAQACYSYAMEVVKGPWEEGEDKILKSSKFSYLYALNVIKGRWEKGEDKIAEHYGASLAYAKNVLKGRFHKGEGWIFKKRFTIGGGAMEESKFFWNTDAPGDRCRSSLDSWNCYKGLEAQDVYIMELFGERDENFEKKVMRSKRYDDCRFTALCAYSKNCPAGRLPDNMHDYMLNGALKGDKKALEYCERFPDDLLKARALGFAPVPVKRVSSKEKFTDDMKSRLENLVKVQVRRIEGESDRAGKSFKDYIHETRSFFLGLGCETRTRKFFLKRHFPKSGSWKFNSTRTRGLVWFEYDEDRTRSVDCDRYWVGIPEDFARRCLLAGKFPA